MQTARHFSQIIDVWTLPYELGALTLITGLVMYQVKVHLGYGMHSDSNVATSISKDPITPTQNLFSLRRVSAKVQRRRY